MYYDTHAHYDDERFDEDRDAVLLSLPENGIELVNNIGTDEQTSLACVALAEKYDFCYAAVGFHPHEASSMDETSLERIAGLLKHPKVRAIGEIGLDYYYDYSPRDIQKACLRAQLALAADTACRVVIHDRDAHGDCLDILSEFPQVTGVFHCFSGSAEMAEILVKRGWYLSFTGSVTFKKARKILEAVAVVPQDRIMLETDSPYLAPEPMRGRRNDSRLLPYIAAAVGAVKGWSVEETARICLENGKRFFNIS